MAQHDKIINTAAKEILAPEGLFRVGQSRRWIDDNGWFVIQVEFQPSGYSKGSYLNVGVHFLWETPDSGDSIGGFDYGYRVTEARYEEYRGNDERFMGHMRRFSTLALDKVKEYRQFQNYEYGREALEHGHFNETWDPYHLAMLSLLHGEVEQGVKQMEAYMERGKSRNFMWCGVHRDFEETMYIKCRDEILPRCSSAEDAQHMVLEMIQRRRALICARSSYKKMKPEFIFQGQEY